VETAGQRDNGPHAAWLHNLPDDGVVFMNVHQLFMNRQLDMTSRRRRRPS